MHFGNWNGFFFRVKKLINFCASNFQLSAFIVHSISEHPSAIEDVVNTFHSQQMPNVNQETQSWILMEILGAIPEEVVY